MKTAFLSKLKVFLFLFASLTFISGIAQKTTTANKNATPVKPKDGGTVDQSPTPQLVLPSIQFKNATPVKPIISKDQMLVLDKVAATIKANPEGFIKVSGYGSTTKMEQQSSWEQVNAVIRYLVDKKGISPKRFIFNYGNEGVPGTVDLTFTTEDGPKSVPAPHPDLRIIN